MENFDNLVDFVNNCVVTSGKYVLFGASAYLIYKIAKLEYESYKDNKQRNEITKKGKINVFGNELEDYDTNTLESAIRCLLRSQGIGSFIWTRYNSDGLLEIQLQKDKLMDEQRQYFEGLIIRSLGTQKNSVAEKVLFIYS